MDNLLNICLITKDMTKLYITHERANCIGCIACAALDPKNWKMNKDGKSDLIKSEKIDLTEKKEFQTNELEKNIEVAQCCPVNVIHIIKDGEKII